MLRRFLRNVLPWLIAAGLMGHLFYTIPLDDLTAALRETNLPGLLAVVLFVDLGSLLGDSWATSRVLTWFLAPVGFLELVPVRAATYLMAILNYNLGQAGMVYYIHRVKRAPLWSVTGLFLMMMGTMLLILSLLSAGGALLAPHKQSQPLALALGSLALGAVAYFIVLRLRPRWLMRWSVLRPLFNAGVTGHLRATAARIPHVSVVIVTHFLALRCYDIAVPLGAALVFIPSVLLVSALPVTPFGLGTMQMTAVHFFAPYAPGATRRTRQAQVFAYSLSLATLALLFQAVMGLFCLKRVSAYIAAPEAGGDDGAGDGQRSEMLSSGRK